jgi:uncharacterized membrane protein YfcA
VNWIIFAIFGAVAQLIDGALGMGFGLTSSTLLITAGATAAVASAAVHVAEIGTTLASGLSHWQAENVDKKVMIRLAIPGSIGAFLGANFLSNIDLSSSKVFISTILLMLEYVLLYRNIFKTNSTPNLVEINNPKFLTFLGLSGGFIDASGGGGWGPVVTPTIISTTSTEPRKVIGTVSASEFCVALAASLGFLVNINKINLDWSTIGGLAIGGILAAPIAAKLVAKLHPKHLGIIVGVAIILLNAIQIIRA